MSLIGKIVEEVRPVQPGGISVLTIEVAMSDHAQAGMVMDSKCGNHSTEHSGTSESHYPNGAADKNDSEQLWNGAEPTLCELWYVCENPDPLSLSIADCDVVADLFWATPNVESLASVMEDDDVMVLRLSAPGPQHQLLKAYILRGPNELRRHAPLLAQLCKDHVQLYRPNEIFDSTKGYPGEGHSAKMEEVKRKPKGKVKPRPTPEGSKASQKATKPSTPGGDKTSQKAAKPRWKKKGNKSTVAVAAPPSASAPRILAEKCGECKTLLTGAGQVGGLCVPCHTNLSASELKRVQAQIREETIKLEELKASSAKERSLLAAMVPSPEVKCLCQLCIVGGDPRPCIKVTQLPSPDALKKIIEQRGERGRVTEDWFYATAPPQKLVSTKYPPVEPPPVDVVVPAPSLVEKPEEKTATVPPAVNPVEKVVTPGLILQSIQPGEKAPHVTIRHPRVLGHDLNRPDFANRGFLSYLRRRYVEFDVRWGLAPSEDNLVAGAEYMQTRVCASLYYVLLEGMNTLRLVRPSYDAPKRVQATYFSAVAGHIHTAFRSYSDTRVNNEKKVYEWGGQGNVPQMSGPEEARYRTLEACIYHFAYVIPIHRTNYTSTVRNRQLVASEVDAWNDLGNEDRSMWLHWVGRAFRVVGSGAASLAARGYAAAKQAITSSLPVAPQADKRKVPGCFDGWAIPSMPTWRPTLPACPNWSIPCLAPQRDRRDYVPVPTAEPVRKKERLRRDYLLDSEASSDEEDAAPAPLPGPAFLSLAPGTESMDETKVLNTAVKRGTPPAAAVPNIVAPALECPSPLPVADVMSFISDERNDIFRDLKHNAAMRIQIHVPEHPTHTGSLAPFCDEYGFEVQENAGAGNCVWQSLFMGTQGRHTSQAWRASNPGRPFNNRVLKGWRRWKQHMLEQAAQHLAAKEQEPWVARFIQNSQCEVKDDEKMDYLEMIESLAPDGVWGHIGVFDMVSGLLNKQIILIMRATDGWSARTINPTRAVDRHSMIVLLYRNHATLVTPTVRFGSHPSWRDVVAMEEQPSLPLPGVASNMAGTAITQAGADWGPLNRADNMLMPHVFDTAFVHLLQRDVGVMSEPIVPAIWVPSADHLVNGLADKAPYLFAIDALTPLPGAGTSVESPHPSFEPEFDPRRFIAPNITFKPRHASWKLRKRWLVDAERKFECAEGFVYTIGVYNKAQPPWVPKRSLWNMASAMTRHYDNEGVNFCPNTNPRSSQNPYIKGCGECDMCVLWAKVPLFAADWIDELRRELKEHVEVHERKEFESLSPLAMAKALDFVDAAERIEDAGYDTQGLVVWWNNLDRRRRRLYKKGVLNRIMGWPNQEALGAMSAFLKWEKFGPTKVNTDSRLKRPRLVVASKDPGFNAETGPFYARIAAILKKPIRKWIEAGCTGRPPLVAVSSGMDALEIGRWYQWCTENGYTTGLEFDFSALDSSQNTGFCAFVDGLFYVLYTLVSDLTPIEDLFMKRFRDRSVDVVWGLIRYLLGMCSGWGGTFQVNTLGVVSAILFAFRSIMIQEFSRLYAEASECMMALGDDNLLMLKGVPLRVLQEVNPIMCRLLHAMGLFPKSVVSNVPSFCSQNFCPVKHRGDDGVWVETFVLCPELNRFMSRNGIIIKNKADRSLYTNAEIRAICKGNAISRSFFWGIPPFRGIIAYYDEQKYEADFSCWEAHQVQILHAKERWAISDKLAHFYLVAYGLTMADVLELENFMWNVLTKCSGATCAFEHPLLNLAAQHYNAVRG